MKKSLSVSVPVPAKPTAGPLTRERFLALKPGWEIIDGRGQTWIVIDNCTHQRDRLVLRTPGNTNKVVFWREDQDIMDERGSFLFELNDDYAQVLPRTQA